MYLRKPSRSDFRRTRTKKLRKQIGTIATPAFRKTCNQKKPQKEKRATKAHLTKAVAKVNATRTQQQRSLRNRSQLKFDAARRTHAHSARTRRITLWYPRRRALPRYRNQKRQSLMKLAKQKSTMMIVIASQAFATQGKVLSHSHHLPLHFSFFVRTRETHLCESAQSLKRERGHTVFFFFSNLCVYVLIFFYAPTSVLNVSSRERTWPLEKSRRLIRVWPFLNFCVWGAIYLPRFFFFFWFNTGPSLLFLQSRTEEVVRLSKILGREKKKKRRGEKKTKGRKSLSEQLKVKRNSSFQSVMFFLKKTSFSACT